MMMMMRGSVRYECWIIIGNFPNPGYLTFHLQFFFHFVTSSFSLLLFYFRRIRSLSLTHTHTHTFTHLLIEKTRIFSSTPSNRSKLIRTGKQIDLFIFTSILFIRFYQYYELITTIIFFLTQIFMSFISYLINHLNLIIIN